MSVSTSQSTREGLTKGAARDRFSCVSELLAHHARQTPERIAILAPGRRPMNYGVLWEQTNELACALRGAGIDRADRVAVVLPPGAEAAVAMVGVAATSVCVPLNPHLTEDEYRRYFGELHLRALLTSAMADSAGRRAAEAMGIPVLEMSPRGDREAGSFKLIGHEPPQSPCSEFAASTDDAFILLTSGSTSRPKTVPLTHASVCLSAANVGAHLSLGPRDRLLHVLPLFHGHGLISGLLAALTAGSSAVFTSGFDATQFFTWLREFQPTWYTAVPAIHQAVLAAAARNRKTAKRHSPLRLIRSASTSLSRQTLDGLEALFGVPVIDTYGMTEAATQIAANPLHRRKPGSVGRAAGAEIAILDGRGRQLSPGRRGEIALRGPTITRGYDNDAAATAAAFRGGWFRTGDLGYLDKDGYLFIVGRLKEIIHKGGQKIAPGEVEAALLVHPDVIDAAVLAVPHPRLGSEVAAAVVLRQGAGTTVRELRDFARKRLAGFKVPGDIRILSEIPKGAGGKIKRAELASAFSPPAESDRDAKSGRHQSEIALELATAWANILNVDHVKLDQDVLALGVDSLAMMQMLLRIEERFGVVLSFDDIFDAPTAAALALRVASAKRRAVDESPQKPQRNNPPAATASRKIGPQPVAIVQERMLRIERKLPGLPQFNLPFAYRLEGPLDVATLRRSLAEVVRRHASLRTSFKWRKGAPVAIVAPAGKLKPKLTVTDLSTPTRTNRARLKELLLKKVKLEIEQKALRRIDTDQAPLFRAFLFRLDAEDHVLLLVFHDIIIDGWSVTIFMEELSEFYSAAMADRKAEISEPGFQFFEFAGKQRQWSTTAAADRQFTQWQRALENFSPLFSTPVTDVGGELISRVVPQPFQVSSDLVTRLKRLGQDQGATLFMSLLAGFKALLLLRSGRTDICVATLMANRSQTGRDQVIGPFANTTLIRTQIDPNLTFNEALRRVRQSVSESYARQELPFDTIASRLSEETGLSPSSLVQIYFVLQMAFRRPVKLADVSVRQFMQQEGRTVMPIDRAWLSMTLKENPVGVTGLCEHKSELLSQNAGLDWAGDYVAILTRLVANPTMQLGRLTDMR